MSSPAYPEEPIAYERSSPPLPALDPLRYCVMTTVALLAWLLSPPVIVATLGALGFSMYWQAIRGGLTRTRCVLRHPTLVLAYLALASVAGIAGMLTGF